jgi:hypothetical protein
MNCGLARNLSYHFLKFGDATLMSDKLEPKAEKYVFIGYPKTLGTPSTTDPKARSLLPKMDPFKKRSFLKRSEWEESRT